MQLSLQDSEPGTGRSHRRLSGAQEASCQAAALVRARGPAADRQRGRSSAESRRLEAIIALAVKLGAERLEVAHVQYYGWALDNRAGSAAEPGPTRRSHRDRRRRAGATRGPLVIDYVVPDYYARSPKACMGGWGRRFLNVTPAGKVLPCHAAETIPGAAISDRRASKRSPKSGPLAGLQAYRGTDWMPEPCRSCERRRSTGAAAAARRWRWPATQRDRSGLLAVAAPRAARRLLAARPPQATAAFVYRQHSAALPRVAVPAA